MTPAPNPMPPQSRGTHKCGNPHCNGQALEGQLACWPCWTTLTREQRANITDANQRRDRAAYRDHLRDAHHTWARAAGVY